jgi:hypothetical protein
VSRATESLQIRAACGLRFAKWVDESKAAQTLLEQKGTFRVGSTSYTAKNKTARTSRETIMATKPSIKIIKRNERAAQVATTEEIVVKKTTQEAARDVVATVSEWVNEFQQRRRGETAQALKMLMHETTPHLNEA